MRGNDTHFFPDNRITVKYFCRVSLPTLPSLETVNYEYTEATRIANTHSAKFISWYGTYLIWGIVSSMGGTEHKNWISIGSGVCGYVTTRILLKLLLYNRQLEKRNDRQEPETKMICE